MCPFLCPYLKRGLGALAVTFLVVAPDLAAQTGTIAGGGVTDSQTGRPIAAAQVFIPELEPGALSRQNGSYVPETQPSQRRATRCEPVGVP